MVPRLPKYISRVTTYEIPVEMLRWTDRREIKHAMLMGMAKDALSGINYMGLGPLDFCGVGFLSAKSAFQNIPLFVMPM